MYGSAEILDMNKYGSGGPYKVCACQRAHVRLDSPSNASHAAAALGALAHTPQTSTQQMALCRLRIHHP